MYTLFYIFPLIPNYLWGYEFIWFHIFHTIPNHFWGYGFICLHIFHIIPNHLRGHGFCAFVYELLTPHLFPLLDNSRENIFIFYLIISSDLTWGDHLSKIWFAPWLSTPWLSAPWLSQGLFRKSFHDINMTMKQMRLHLWEFFPHNIWD